MACRTGFASHSGFLHWLYWTDKRVDFLSQWDLEHVRGPAALRRAYDLIVFAGHHEYVTTREYDLVERYRDLGGNLMFLSANNYFWRVERHGNISRSPSAGETSVGPSPHSSAFSTSPTSDPRGVHGLCDGRRLDDGC